MVDFVIEKTIDEGATFAIDTSFFVNGKEKQIRFQFSKEDLKNDRWKQKLADRIEREVELAKVHLDSGTIEQNKTIKTDDFKKKEPKK